VSAPAWPLAGARVFAGGLVLAAAVTAIWITPSGAHAAPAGQLYGSGENDYGQLGTGEPGTSYLYQPIPDLSNVVQASPGYDVGLALLADGTVDAFGLNEAGELGDGTTVEHTAPETIPGLSDVTAVAAGPYRGYALLGDGTVRAWGEDAHGELGNGELEVTGCDCATSPVQVKGLAGTGTLSNVVAISAGFYGAMALLSDGTVVDWGYNYYGELGDGGTLTSDVPVQVKGVGGVGRLSNVIAISAGLYDDMALLSNGTVVAWGYGADGELGDGEAVQSDVPVQVKGIGGAGLLSGVSAISAGDHFNLALLSNGGVEAWGSGKYHELGDGEAVQSDLPVQVSGLAGVSAIAAGGYFGQALESSGALFGWGLGTDGELGDGVGAEVPRPRELTTAPAGVFALGHGDDNDQSFLLQGATLGLSAARIAFGGQTLGSQSAARTVTLKNEGPAPLTVSGDVLAGSGEFAVTSGDCSGVKLAAGATCSVSIVFSPLATGEATASLAVSSTAVNTPVISLAGTGVVAQLPPELHGLRLSASAFRAATRGPSAVNVIAPGSVVTYTDSEAGITIFTVEEAVSGFRAGSGSSARCDPSPRHRRRGAKRCVSYEVIGSFGHLDRAGPNRFRFTGRVKGRRLSPGSYRLVAVAHSPSGRSASRTASFRILAIG
jgi:alpha-tubulin suppressor-like RCC1 family protein